MKVRQTLLSSINLEKVITRKVYQGPHEETAILTMEFESGATAEMCNSVLFPGVSAGSCQTGELN